MSEWKSYKLGDLAVFNYGKSLVADKRNNGTIPVYSSSGISGWHDEALVESEAIIIGRKGNVGSVFYTDKPFYCIDTAYYILPSDKYDLKFLYYKLQSLNLIKLTSDSAVPGLNRETAYSQKVEIPEDLELQIKLASILSSLDDKIELNQQLNQTLEAIAKAIFKEWFVNFNFPGFDGELINGLPKNWKISKLNEMVDVKGGSTPSTSVPEYWDGEYYWTTPKDLSNSRSPVILDTERKITEDGVRQISSGVLPKGTLLLSSRAPIGYLAISQIPISINQGYIAIQGKSVSNLYMLFWLRQNMDAVKGMANGSTFQEISKSNFKVIETHLPDREILRLFDETINPLFDRIVANEIEIKTLTQLRDSLLPKLMSGKIEIKN